jgi:hypothetical protein
MILALVLVMMYPLKLMKSYLYNKHINETIEELFCVVCCVWCGAVAIAGAAAAPVTTDEAPTKGTLK